MAIEQVDPAKCTLWQFHERFGDELSSESCKELIASLRRHGQRHPALGRRLASAPSGSIELIYGGRRLFAATQLGIKLLVDVQELDDKEAIVEMEIENRLRTDICSYERGMSYRRWLNAGLFASQSQLAKELSVSEAQVSRLLRYADLPAAVIGAFDAVQSIREEWAVALARICQDTSCRPGILRRAREISQRKHYPPHVIFRRLVSTVQLSESEAGKRRDEVVKSLSGKPIYRVAVRAKAVHFIISRAGLSERVVEDVKRLLASTLETVIDEKDAARAHHYARPNPSSSYESVIGSA